MQYLGQISPQQLKIVTQLKAAVRYEDRSCKTERSQWVDATLAQGPRAGVCEADFAQGRWFNRNTALLRF